MNQAAVSTRVLPLAATLGALGVVYGDIGTSPLYAFKEAARALQHGGAPISHDAILGIVSLIFWSLIVVISMKYAWLILRADNRGEGGIMAMLALLSARSAQPGTRQAKLLLVGLIGAALLYGDGAITPAISVLSAVEGLKVDAPQLAPAVVPLAVAILLAVFWVQHKGVALIGRIFGPVMLIWFVTLGALGIGGIVHAPQVLAALSPLYAIDILLSHNFHIGFAILGAAFLAVTGGEAMYADMGHFGRLPIRIAWFGVALPGLVLNYFGQAALLLTQPAAVDNPFYQLAPDWFHYPLIVFATLAAIIASQAIISGVFSLTQQAIQLGFLPRMQVRHTASHEMGQIYVPFVNWLLCAATLTAVLTFKTSDALTGAYGIAVSLLMAITTLLAALVAVKWGYSLWMVILVNGAFFVIDLVFFAANATKFLDGGWFPLLLAAILATFMLTWLAGVQLVARAREALREPEDKFIGKMLDKSQTRLPGAAAFMSPSLDGMPISLERFVKHSNALYEHVLIVTVVFEEVPRVPDSQRATVTSIGNGIWRVVLRFGFMQRPTVSAALKAAAKQGSIEIDPACLTYYIGRETIIASRRRAGMAPWRKGLFAFMQRNAERSAAFFGIPTKQVVEFGAEIEI